MINAIFTGLLTIMTNLVSAVCYIPNQIINATLPSISAQILQASEGIHTITYAMVWATGLVPRPIIVTLVFILTIEIAKHTIFMSTDKLVKLWNILQKIKFW